MSDCNKLKELLSLYCDGEVTPEEKELVEKHIAECSSCKQKLDIMLKAKKILGNSQAVPVPENLFNDFVKYKEDKEKQEKKVIPFYKNYRMYASLAAVFIFAFVLKSGLLEQNKYVNDPVTQNTYNGQTLTAPQQADKESEMLKSVPQQDALQTDSAKPKQSDKTVNMPVAESMPTADTPVVAQAPAENTPQVAAFSVEDEMPTEHGNSGATADNSRMITPPEDVNMEVSDIEEELETQAKIYVLPQYEKRASELLGDNLYLLYQAEQKLNENDIPFESNFLLLDETIPYNIIVNVITE